MACFGVEGFTRVLSAEGGDIRESQKVRGPLTLWISGLDGRIRIRGTSDDRFQIVGKYSGSNPGALCLSVKGERVHLSLNDTDPEVDIFSDVEAPSMSDTAEIPIYTPVTVDLEIRIPHKYLRHLRIESRNLSVLLEELKFDPEEPAPSLIVSVSHSGNVLLKNLSLAAGTGIFLTERGNVTLTSVNAKHLYGYSRVGQLLATDCVGHLEWYAESGGTATVNHQGQSSGSGLGLSLERDLIQGEFLNVFSGGRSRACVYKIISIPFAWDKIP